MARGNKGKKIVFNFASDTWHMGVVSECVSEGKKHHEKVLPSETLRLLEEEKPSNVFQGRPKCHTLSLRCNYAHLLKINTEVLV